MTDTEEKLPTDFVWTYEKANALLNEVIEANTPLFIDQKYLQKAKLKLNTIAQLKLAVKQSLTEKHEIKLLKECLRQLEDMETVDFTVEIQKIKEKIKLLVDVKNAIDNESRMKKSVEMLESLS